MLRALLLGILALSGAAGCKGKSDSSAVPAKTAAGKVVSVSGTVEATRGGATRPLAAGAEVFADDEVKTGADAAVEIELFHNHAKWSLTANKQGRVDGSLAWGMDKQEASKAVEHNTAAAGREAERSAAETSATATEAPKLEQPKAESMPAPKAEPIAPSTGAAPGASAGGGAPPPPPPPRMTTKPMADEQIEEKEATKKESAPARDKGAPMADPVAPHDAKNVISPQTVADRHKPEFAKCFAESTPATITIDVRMNKASTSISGVKNVTAKQRTCVAGVAKAIEWPMKGITFQVKVKL
jgi:hypothetical protein